MKKQNICVLGSTGSIGKSTLDVIARHPDILSVYALSAHTRIEELAKQAHESHARVVIVPTDAAHARFRLAWPGTRAIPEVRVGAEALCDTVRESDVTTVMAAIVGAAGLPSTLAAARAGKRLLLANKEALIAAGSLLMQAVREGGAELLPVDSEHNAIFQCLPEIGQTEAPTVPVKGVRRLLLTASGGPFRTASLDQLAQVTPEQACAHPNWTMGPKISVDSATMLNKGLEIIEAHWLFAMPVNKIQVLIHPQSIVHSMVEYKDGSILAQLGQPDMRTPIAHALGFPERIDSGVGLMDLTALGRLDFERPDYDRFPCLRLSFEALQEGQAACITLNAANEIAVERFLQRQIRYTEIALIIESCLERLRSAPEPLLSSLEDILALDAQVRRMASDLCLQQQ